MCDEGMIARGGDREKSEPSSHCWSPRRLVMRGMGVAKFHTFHRWGWTGLGAGR